MSDLQKLDYIYKTLLKAGEGGTEFFEMALHAIGLIEQLRADARSRSLEEEDE